MLCTFSLKFKPTKEIITFEIKKKDYCYKCILLL